MKKIALLVFSTLLAAIVVSCSKDETTSRDAGLAGVNVAVGEKNGKFDKLFVLNEGNFQKNNSTLDFFRFSDGNYISDAFGQMNPTVIQGIGDTGNDIALQDGKLWLVMNGSSTVHVLDAKDEDYLSSITVPDPRYITFDKSYAYVSSYAGAVYGGDETKGKVYKINTDTYKVEGEVEVGCQPEGLAVADGKLYVANSGGYNYTHESTVSVIDLSTFKVSGQIETASNLHFLAASSNGDVWVSSYGESTWSQDASDNWIQSMSEPMGLYRISGGKSTAVKDVHVSCMALCDNGFIYAIGNADELAGGYSNTLYKVNVKDASVTSVALSGTEASKVSNPYGILANPDTGDIYIADSGLTYTDPGKVWCFTKDLKLKWSATAGMLPAHMVLY